MRLSIIMPVLDEAPLIEHALRALQSLRDRGHEVIVVDGGSVDATLSRSAPLSDTVLRAPRGRAAQMNAGAAAARGEVLLFLHADTKLPAQADELIVSSLQGTQRDWGRFDVRIDSRHVLLVCVARMMNLRSRLTSVCTGDQAIFVRRELFVTIGGYPVQPLMEDISLCKRLRRHSPPLCIRQPVLTSARRWQRIGVLRTITLMWWLRLRYFLGAPATRLARLYHPGRSG